MKRDLVKEFVEFLENLNNRGKPTLNIIRENDKEINFQGEIPKSKLREFLNQIQEGVKQNEVFNKIKKILFTEMRKLSAGELKLALTIIELAIEMEEQKQRLKIYEELKTDAEKPPEEGFKSEFMSERFPYEEKEKRDNKNEQN